MNQSLRALTANFPHSGTLQRIFLRSRKFGEINEVNETMVIEKRGLAGDHRSESATRSRKREVSLIQAEHIPVIAALSGHDQVNPADLRRNLLISGLNLIAARSLFKDQPMLLTIGESACFEITDDCAPCSRMEKLLGAGGYNAMRGHGGMLARVITGGTIRCGDSVRCIAASEMPTAP